MTEYILSIDPGLSTGISLISYEEDEAPELEAAWQFPGGVETLVSWVKDNHYDRNGFVTVIAEKFTARNTKGFSYKTDSLEPLRCEGALIALDVMPDYSVKEKRWKDPGLQYLVGGVSLADKKKRQHKFLKDSGFYRTGKDFGTPDADDFRSSCSHALSFLARERRHRPTFDMIQGWVDANP